MRLVITHTTPARQNTSSVIVVSRQSLLRGWTSIVLQLLLQTLIIGGTPNTGYFPLNMDTLLGNYINFS